MVSEMMASLGTHRDIVFVHPAASRNLEVHQFAYATRERVGGNIQHSDEGGAHVGVPPLVLNRGAH